MKSVIRERLLYLFHIFIIMAAVVSCAPPEKKVFTSYTVPGVAGVNVEDIQNIVIEKPKLTMTNKDAAQVFGIYLSEKLNSSIYKEQYLAVADCLCGDKKGEGRLKERLKGNNWHGYSELHAGRVARAKMLVSADIIFKEEKGADNITTEVHTTPYVVLGKKDKDGNTQSEPKKDKKGNIEQVVDKHQTKVDFVKYDLSGTVHFKMTSPKGEQLYNKSYPVKLVRKVGGNSATISGYPTYLELAAELLQPAVEKVVKDISPHKETRELKINENGDKSAVVLMKATAFLDAKEVLEQAIKKNETTAQEKTKQIEEAFEKDKKRIEETVKAEKEREEAVKRITAEKTAKIKEAGRILSPDYENFGILREILGMYGAAIENYQLAYKSDETNKSAAAAEKRVAELIENVKKMKDKDAELQEKGMQRPGYEHKENENHL